MTKRISNFIVVLSLLASFTVIGIAIASQPNTGSVLMQASQSGVVAGNFVKVGTDGNIVRSTALADLTIGVAEANGPTTTYSTDPNYLQTQYVPVAIPGLRASVRCTATPVLGALVYPGSDGNALQMSASWAADANIRPRACGRIIAVPVDANWATILVLEPR